MQYANVKFGPISVGFDFYLIISKDSSKQMEEKMNKKIEYFVRTMCLADNDEVNEVCAKAGMLISNYSNITMMKIDPNCLQVAEDVNTGK